MSDKKYILRNNGKSDIYLQDFKPVIIVRKGSCSRKVFTAKEINESQDINIFISSGILEAIEASEENGTLVNKQMNSLQIEKIVPSKPRDFRKEGVMVKDGIVTSIGTEDLGDSAALIPGTRVRIKGSNSLVGILGNYSENLGRWEVELDDGRKAYALERDLIDLELGVNSQNIDGEKEVLYAEDLIKRGLVAPENQMKRSNTLMAGNIIKRASSGNYSLDLSGKPVDEDGTPGGRFKAGEVIARPLFNNGENVEIISAQGQPIPRKNKMASEGTIIVNGEDGMGEEVPVEKIIKGTGEVIGKKLEHAAKLEAAKQKQKKSKYELKKERKMKKKLEAMGEASPPTVVSAEVEDFFSKPIHIQKFGISKMKDIEKLTMIARMAKDENIAMLAMERIEQLKETV